MASGSVTNSAFRNVTPKRHTEKSKHSEKSTESGPSTSTICTKTRLHHNVRSRSETEADDEDDQRDDRRPRGILAFGRRLLSVAARSHKAESQPHLRVVDQTTAIGAVTRARQQRSMQPQQQASIASHAPRISAQTQSSSVAPIQQLPRYPDALQMQQSPSLRQPGSGTFLSPHSTSHYSSQNYTGTIGIPPDQRSGSISDVDVEIYSVHDLSLGTQQSGGATVSGCPPATSQALMLEQLALAHSRARSQTHRRPAPPPPMPNPMLLPQSSHPQPLPPLQLSLPPPMQTIQLQPHPQFPLNLRPASNMNSINIQLLQQQQQQQQQQPPPPRPQMAFQMQMAALQQHASACAFGVAPPSMPPPQALIRCPLHAPELLLMAVTQLPNGQIAPHESLMYRLVPATALNSIQPPQAQMQQQLASATLPLRGAHRHNHMYYGQQNSSSSQSSLVAAALPALEPVLWPLEANTAQMPSSSGSNDGAVALAHQQLHSRGGFRLGPGPTSDAAEADPTYARLQPEHHSHMLCGGMQSEYSQQRRCTCPTASLEKHYRVRHY